MNICIILSKMAQKFLIWVKTGIFYEFSKWRKIEIQKPITEPQNLPKRNGSRVVRDVKPGLRSLGVSFACCDYDQRLWGPKQCRRDVLFSAVTMFEAKRKGYCFIPYPFTVKVSPKSKMEGESGSILWNQNVLTWNTPSIRRCALSTSQIEEDYTNRFADYLVRRLKRDEIGVCVFPSKHARCVRATKLHWGKPESERSKRKVRYFSASVSLPVIFCSLTLAKTNVFSCKYNNYDAVFIRETERCNGKFSASTGSVQVLISLSRSVFSTAVHTKQNQSRPNNRLF